MTENEAKIVKDRINRILPFVEGKVKQELEDMLNQIHCLAENNGWIPVTERLPECDEKCQISRVVWCLDAYGKTGFGIYQNQLREESWFIGGGAGENNVKITHWMPLPGLPQSRVAQSDENQRPDCYNANDDPYPLCKGKSSDECLHCCLYENMIEG